MKQTDVQVIVKRPGEPAAKATIHNTLESLQALVGGYIEVVSLYDHHRPDLVAIVNEEGRLLGLPHNVRGLVGTIVIAKVKGDDFVGMNDKQATELIARVNAWEGRTVCA